MTTAALERTILRILFEAHPRMVKGKQLFNETNVEHSVAVTRGDFDQALKALQAKDGGAQIFGVTGDDDSKWKITDEGIARLAA